VDQAAVPDECHAVRGAASALGDGEEAILAPDVVDAHLATCPDCRSHLAAVEALDRRLRLAAAPRVPDLSAQILAAVDLGARTRRDRQRRWVVALTGAVMVVLALPGVTGAAFAHAQREVAVLEVAIGLALVLCARRPRRLAAGIFPVVAGMSLLVLATALLDLSAGLTTPLAEVAHLPPVMAAVLVWPWARAAWMPRHRSHAEPA
jgi:predicted anti-sigma-YlaC factor YlaD